MKIWMFTNLTEKHLSQSFNNKKIKSFFSVKSFFRFIFCSVVCFAFQSFLKLKMKLFPLQNCCFFFIPWFSSCSTRDFKVLSIISKDNLSCFEHEFYSYSMMQQSLWKLLIIQLSKIINRYQHTTLFSHTILNWFLLVLSGRVFSQVIECGVRRHF